MPPHTEHRNHSEPQQHQRSEYVADARCPAALYGKKTEQDSNCRRHDVALEHVGRDVDALECAQYRDCRCDDAIAIKQGRSEQAHDDECAAAIEPGRAGERHQRQDPAFTMVVRAHHEEAVLDGDCDDERPQDQREDADGGLWGKLSTDGLDDLFAGYRAGSSRGRHRRCRARRVLLPVSFAGRRGLQPCALQR
jgi:hypothetical protein